MRSERAFSVLQDNAGNVAVIAAAALIPMMALVGGGVDTGRAYMVKTQLQSACDAGVLAGRRAMSGSGAYDTAEKAKAKSLFDFNFDASAVNATNVVFTSAANAQGQVSGTASATIPTVVMAMFGNETVDVSTDCMAELQIANTDVMFVLDSTGSMGGSRIAGLREAVKDFHKTMNTSIKDANTRLRYGFVPYSMTVNASELVTGTLNSDGTVRDDPMPADYFRDSAPYETRRAQFNTPEHLIKNQTTISSTIETSYAFNRKWKCQDWADNYGDNPEVVSGSKPGKVREKFYSFENWNNGQDRCRREVVERETTYETKFRFSNWRYQEWDLDTSVLKTGSAVTIGTDMSNAYADQAGYYDVVEMAKKNGSVLHNVGTKQTTWSGCIEERDTVDDATWDPVPSNAYDLDINLAPTSDETRWRPIWEDVVYSRNYQNFEDTTSNRSQPSTACPSPMKLFTEVALSSDPNDVPQWLDDYLTGLVATGNTYHDIGMIWGGRLASPRGIFAANVNRDNKAVSRHLIYMTDGKLEPNIGRYNAYGVEELSNRIAPQGSNTSTVTARHTARFLAACEAVKAQGLTVWVIAFGTTLTDDLKTCSSDGRAYKSDDTDELKKTFKFIASQVANLRLGA